MSVVRAVLGRPVTVAMACIAAMLTGLVGLQVIPLQLLPEGFENRGMTLIFPYANADPYSVERDVAQPVEEALATVADIEEVDVRCSPNRARVRIDFSGRTDMDLAALEVRDRLERLRPELPTEAQRYLIFRHSAANIPDMAYGALVPRELGLEAFRILENRLLPRLGRVDGIAQVDTWGGLVDRQVEIELDEDRVEAHRVDLRELIQRLQTENFSLPAGTVRDGMRRLFVRSVAPFEDLAALESYPVDRRLTVGDLGEAVVKAGYRNRVARIDGEEVVWIIIRKESGRNTVEACRAVREAVAGLADDEVLGRFKLIGLWDAGASIEGALAELRHSILWGGFLAIIVLLLFLRDGRATLVVAAAIPFSVLVSIAVLTLLSYTLNVLTLAGLTLAVGMLVDNAIVVVENVLRRREGGEEPLTAAAHGSGEVALAITLATFTTIVVFLPLIFVADEPQVRVMIANLAGPISFGLLASLATALLVVPLLAAKLRTGLRGAPTRGPLVWARERTVALVGLVLRHRIEAVVAAALLVGGGGWWLSERVKRVGEGGGMFESVRARVELDASTTLAEASEVFARYEEALIPRREELGVEHVQVRFDERDGRIELRLKPSAEREPIERIRERVEELLPEIPGAAVSFGGGHRGDEEEGEDDDKDRRVEIALSGPDTDLLYALAAEVKERLDETGVFEEVTDGIGESEREIVVELDREAVSRAGTAGNIVLGVLGYQLRGSRLADIRLGDDDVPLLIRYREPEDEGLGWLKSMAIATMTGQVSLEALADVRTARGPHSIRRVDRRTQVEVVATLPRLEADRGDRAARQVMATFPLPEGFSYEIQGALRELAQQEAEVMRVLALGVAFMFLIMGVLFESFLLPVAVLPSIPFAFLGAYLALYVTGTPQDIVATLGSVILAGIVVNNAIVLVDAINRGLDGGLSQEAAVLAGVRDRFRPVLLTAATTIVGLLPMAWEPASEGVMSYHSLARAVIGGLAVSTLGTLVVVPLGWAILDDLRLALMRIVGRFWR